jgi:predicted permease
MLSFDLHSIDLQRLSFVIPLYVDQFTLNIMVAMVLSMHLSSLFWLYLYLIGWTALGWGLSHWLPRSSPHQLGRFLFWIGVPISVVAFLRRSHLSVNLWMAPAIAWIAILAGAGLARLWVNVSGDRRLQNSRSQGSFLLASMFGNTGYIGYPVSMALVGTQYFAWVLFYDMIGSGIGSYGLGVVLAEHFGVQTQDRWQALWAIAKNPVLWSFLLGLMVKDFPLPAPVETSLQGFAWSVVALSLALVGMRLGQLSSFKSIKPAMVSLGIKMVFVPLVVGLGLKVVGITGPVHLAMLLQMGMPPAFATLVIAETYELDQELTVTALVLGALSLLVMLPIWLWLFGAS